MRQELRCDVVVMMSGDSVMLFTQSMTVAWNTREPARLTAVSRQSGTRLVKRVSEEMIGADDGLGSVCVSDQHGAGVQMCGHTDWSGEDTTEPA